MVKVDYELVKIDYEIFTEENSMSYESREFNSLDDVADWLIGIIYKNYAENTGNTVGFGMIEEYRSVVTENKTIGQNIPLKNYPHAMPFKPSNENRYLLIRKITENDKIIFSDGMMTAGQKFWNKEVRDWMQKCYERQMHPKFNFAYDDEDSVANDKQMA